MRGPPRKAKYSLVTDSAREGSEREPETLCLQAVEHLYKVNRVLFVERSGELRMQARLSTKGAEP